MNALFRHVRDFLKAISQSLFFNNAYFGALLLALFWIFDRPLAACGTGAAVVGYIQSVRHNPPKLLRDSGLITINCLFFGFAMACLFGPSPSFYFSLVIGALVLPLVTKATFEVLQHWKLSPFIAPYILSIWVIWLCGHGAGFEYRPDFWPSNLMDLPELHPSWRLGTRVLWSVCESTSRLFFFRDGNFGLSVLTLITAFSPRRGFYFFLGSLGATCAAFLLVTQSNAWEYGLFSYSAGLVGLGMASFPERFTWRRIGLFCVFSTFLTMAATEFLRGVGLPTLSLPYVMTLWLAILSRVPRLSVRWAAARPVVGAMAPMQGDTKEAV